MAVDARGFQLTANPAGSFATGMQQGQQLRSQFMQGQEQESQIQRGNQFRQLSAIVADPSRSPQERQMAQQQMMGVAPEQAQQQQAQTIANLSARQKEILTSVANDFAVYSGLPSIEAKKSAALNNKARLIADGKPTDETDEYIQVLESGDVNEINRLESGIIQAGQLMGTLQGGVGRGAGAGIKSFAPITIINPKTKEKRLVSPTVDPSTGDAVLEPFAMPEGFEVSTETSEEKRAADILATGLKEKAKLSAQLMKKPQIEKAVTEARAIAANRGEAFTELSQAKAALPGLTTAVNNLRELSLIATSTLGGKVFDAAVKESGFGSTKGATARAKFIAIVNNQVLPLLKPTFGAAFTVQEGEALKATMGDPDASPEAKMAQLDAFIEQKLRDIETKEAVLQQPEGGEAQPAAQQAAQATGLENLSIEQLMQMRQQAGGQ
jgi:hypothetical protein